MVSPDAHWYFGIHGLNDLKNAERLKSELLIDKSSLFRIDGIFTKDNDELIKYNEEKRAREHKGSQIRKFAEADICVEIENYEMRIRQGDDIRFEVVLPGDVRKVAIIGDCIFVLMGDASVMLFGKVDEEWKFIRPLETLDNHPLINKRLRHIYMTDGDATFVYNNRIKRYDLKTGELIHNRAVSKAKDRKYSGVDVLERFS